jgi:hypothetical protein
MLNFIRSKRDRIEESIGAGGQGFLAPTGTLSLAKVTIPVVDGEMDLLDIVQHARPNNGLEYEIMQYRYNNAVNISRGLNKIVKAHQLEIPTFYGTLWAKKIDGLTGEEIDYGIVSLRLVTTVGVNFIVDSFQNLVEDENMKFHGIGTGTNAEATGDTALQTELTTQYNPDNTRATGSLTEGASANIFRTVGTNTLDSGTPAITEHGIFSASSAGTLLDRSVFAAINLTGTNGDGLQTTYDFTIAAGG